MMFFHLASFGSDLANKNRSLFYEVVAFSRAKSIGFDNVTCIHSTLQLAIILSRVSGQLVWSVHYSDWHGSHEIVDQVASLRVIHLEHYVVLSRFGLGRRQRLHQHTNRAASIRHAF
jgi:hypothetical protein